VRGFSNTGSYWLRDPPPLTVHRLLRTLAYDVNIEPARLRNHSNDFLNLVESRVARKERFAEQHLRQNAAKTPHVDAFRVVRRREQNLGRAIPTSRHVFRQSRNARIGRIALTLRDRGKRAREPEIADLVQ
jgi:hypothetical protein